MKHLFLVLTSIFLIPVFSEAQSNYKAGYVVTLSGDTVKGLIDYKEWDANPLKFNFKKADGSKTQVYTVNDAAAFGVTGFEYYTKFILPVGHDRD